MPSLLNPRWLLAASLVLALAPDVEAVAIEGQVLHAERPEATADLVVRIRGLTRGGETLEYETRTDAGGRYRFDELSHDAAYLLSAEFAGIPFSGGVITFPAGPLHGTQSRDISVYDAADDPSAVSIAREQWIIERDAGIYRMHQRVKILNSSTRVVRVAADAEPALRVGLASGNGPVATPFGRLPEGTSVSGSSLELRGPIYPGEHDYTFLYELDASTENGGTPRALYTSLAIPDRIPEADLFVQDFGVVVDAPALYAGRPTRDGDVFYLRFVGFDLEADDSVSVRILPLPPARAGSGLLEVAGVALLAGALAWFVVAPFRAHAEPSRPDPRPDEAKSALETALADLEHDFETGKLSEEDRSRLQADLESFHLEAPAPAKTSRESEPVPKTCECGRAAAAADHFCSACGRPL